MSSSPQHQTSHASRTPIPAEAVPLESILCTEKLRNRRSRTPDYKRENSALVALAHALADSPRTILQILADTILEVCQAGSAGISLLTRDEGGQRFYWPAISGRWRQHIGGGTPRDFGPCGDVLDRNTALLFTHVERRYTYFQPVSPAIEECLLVPFYVQGEAVGTIWAIAHDQHRKFDAEDERLMKSLGTFASSAFQIVSSLGALQSHAAARDHAEENHRTLTECLEERVRVRTVELDQRNREVLQQAAQLRDLSHRLIQLQDNERRHIARELHDSAGQILTALGMNLFGIVQRAKQSAPELAKDAEFGQQLVQELSREIRTTAYLLHPPLLDESGLSDALLWYLQGLKERCGLDITLEIPEDFGRCSHEIELAIFRVVQECLTNVHRHSGSKIAAIKIGRSAQTVSIEVEDAGKGLSPEKLVEVQSHGGVGIRGMRERVIQFGGEMTIQSGDWGTKISISVPCDNPSRVQAVR